MGSRGAAPVVFDHGAFILVGGDARAAARGQLWAGGALYVRDRIAFRASGGAADVRENRLVSGLFQQYAAMGADAARGSADRRVDHVDSGGVGLCGVGVGADGGVAERVGAQ